MERIVPSAYAMRFKCTFQSRIHSGIPVSSEISDILLLVSYFASGSKGIKLGNYFFDVCCVN